MDPLTDEQSRAVVSAFLDRMEDGKDLKPAARPLPYDAVPGVATARWRIFVAEELVKDELRELTNQLNHWLGNLRRWHAWNEVLKVENADVRWEAEWGWVEPLAFYCMFQPSASRDRFIMVATNALHQVRMGLDAATVDALLGDPTTPGEDRFFPSRREKEKQLKALARPWTMGKAFIQALGQLDDRRYRALIGDFRNRASHGIAPRFSVGITSTVTRTRQQATKLERQPDGTYKDMPVPGQLSTSYGVGGTEPLSMQQAWTVNLAQFEHARRTFDAYIELLAEGVAAMPRRSGALP